MGSQNSVNNKTYDADFTVNRTTAGTSGTLKVDHADNTNAASHAKLQAESGGGSGGDAFLNLSVSGVKTYSFGIDNSASDNLVLTDNVDPSTGNIILSVDATTRAISFNNAYEFPTSDGTANEVLTTDGAGNVTWQPGGSGTALQYQYSSFTTSGSTSAVIPADTTIPQQTEGLELTTVTITPRSASNLLIIKANFNLESSEQCTMALFQDSTANALAAVPVVGANGPQLFSTVLTHVMTAGTTLATTFKIRVGIESGGSQIRYNNVGGTALYNGVCESMLEVWEVDPVPAPAPLTGQVVNYQYSTYNTYSQTDVVIPYDDTIPQQTEGTEILTVTITPQSASNILVIKYYWNGEAKEQSAFALFQDGTANALTASPIGSGGGGSFGYLALEHIMVAGTVAATTFKIRAGTSSGSGSPIFFNGHGVPSASRLYGGVAQNRLEVWEIKA